jgi:hypothetical protein
VQRNALNHGNLPVAHAVEVSNHDDEKLPVAMASMSVASSCPSSQ